MITRLAQSINQWISLPAALALAIVFQIVWIIVGTLTRMDPYPFIFMLTLSNMIQLVVMFAVANATSKTHERLDEHSSSIGLRQMAMRKHVALSHEMTREEMQKSIDDLRGFIEGRLQDLALYMSSKIDQHEENIVQKVLAKVTDAGIPLG